MFSRTAAVALVSILLAGCGHSATSAIPSVTGSEPSHDVLQGGGRPRTFTRFNPSTYSGLYGGIVRGPDNNMWFLDQGGPGLVRIGMTGETTEFPLPSDPASLNPQMIAVGPKQFFILSPCNQTNPQSAAVDFVTTKGAARSFALPTGQCFGGIAAGPDGNAWITGQNAIYKVTPAGVINQFTYPEGGPIFEGQIVSGPGGLLWFGDNTTFAIGSLDPATGTVNEYPYDQQCFAEALVAPPDGNLWFGCSPGDFSSSSVIRETPTGATTVYPISNPFLVPTFGSVGPGGFPYFTNIFNQGVQPGLLRVDTSNGSMTVIPAPYGMDNFDGVASGPDGNIWISATSGVFNGHIDVYIVHPLTVKPSILNFPSAQTTATLTAKEGKVANLSATTSNVGVATVAPGQAQNTFVVTAIGVGNCTITVQDSKRNSFNVPVVVQ